MTGNRYFAEAVHAAGTTHVFFVPTIMLPAMAEMEDMGIRRVVTHGEKAAAYMADGQVAMFKRRISAVVLRGAAVGRARPVR
jgi:thiamine pyrophosphate-dependent acetolactate synthase large subunit-like protein